MIPDNVNVGIVNFGIGNVGVGDVSINPPNVRDVLYIAEQNLDWMVNPPSAIPPAVPVTVEIGNPVVYMPGCVEVNKENLEKPPNQNQSLVNDDPRQNLVLCDGEMPAYNPINYDPRKLRIEDLTPPKEEEEYEHIRYNGDGSGFGGAAEAVPETPPTKTEEDPPCPGPNAQRIGDVAQNQTEKVSGFELQVDPRNPDGVKICVTLYEDIGAVEQFLPTPQVAATTATIAVVATSSALLAKPLADLLLKVVKPAVKKAIGKVQKMLGKKEKVLSLRERKLKQKEANAGAKAARQLQGK
jgi:hypothetical protein